MQSWGELGDLEIAGQVRDALQKQGAGQNVGALLIRNLKMPCMEERVTQKRSRVSKTLKSKDNSRNFSKEAIKEKGISVSEGKTIEIKEIETWAIDAGLLEKIGAECSISKLAN